MINIANEVETAILKFGEWFPQRIVEHQIDNTYSLFIGHYENGVDVYAESDGSNMRILRLEDVEELTEGQKAKVYDKVYEFIEGNKEEPIEEWEEPYYPKYNHV